jgi:hypothetical protein
MSSAITRSGLSNVAGSGTATYKPSGVIHVSTTIAGTPASLTETDLWTYSLPANTLNANGQSLRITFKLTAAANGNNKTLNFYFGATTVTTVVLSTNNADVAVVARIVRTGATAQSVSWEATAGAVRVSRSSPHPDAAETLGGAVTMRITGTNAVANANELVLKHVIVEYLP